MNLIRNMMLLVLILFNIGYADESLIPRTIYDYAKEFDRQYGKSTLYLRKVIKGNFTNSGHDEYIVFYYPDYSDDTFYTTIRVYVVNGKTILKQYKIESISFFNYNNFEIDMSVIAKIEKCFSKWNGYFYSYDLNQNGISELFLYHSSGVTGTFYIWEFQENKFVQLLPVKEPERLALMTVNKKEKSITKYIAYEPRANDYRFEALIYKWNLKNLKYEKIIGESNLTYEEVMKRK